MGVSGPWCPLVSCRVIRVELLLSLALGVSLVQGCDSGDEPASQPTVEKSADQQVQVNDEQPVAQEQKESEPVRVFVPDKFLKESLDSWDTIEFVGWSEGSELYALKYAQEVGDEGYSATLEALELFDALSGKAVKRFVLDASATNSNEVGDNREPVPEKWRAFIAEASGDWASQKSRFSKTKSGPPETSIVFSISKPPEGTELHVNAENDSAKWEWTWDSPPFDGTPGIDEPPEAPSGNLRLSASLATGDGTSRVLTKRLINELTNCEHKGRANAFWDHSENRFVILVDTLGSYYDMFSGHTGTCGSMDMFPRAIGKQLRLTDGGAGALATRYAAKQLDTGGTPVATLDSAKAPVDKSEVYYRDDAKEYAAKVAKVLGVPLAEKPLEKKGWTSVIVVLGQDFDDLPFDLHPGALVQHLIHRAFADQCV